MNSSSLSTAPTLFSAGGGTTTTTTTTTSSSLASPPSSSIHRPGSHPPPSAPSFQPQQQQQQYHEEKLQKGYRAMGTAVVGILERAEKAGGTEPMNVDRCRDLDRAVVHFLQTRIQFHRLLGHVEATMLGKAEEMESLETYVRTQPKLGSSINDRRKKKRKRPEGDYDDEVVILQKELVRETVASVAVANASAASTKTTTAATDVGGSGSADAPLVLDD